MSQNDAWAILTGVSPLPAKPRAVCFFHGTVIAHVRKYEYHEAKLTLLIGAAGFLQQLFGCFL